MAEKIYMILASMTRQLLQYIMVYPRRTVLTCHDHIAQTWRDGGESAQEGHLSNPKLKRGRVAYMLANGQHKSSYLLHSQPSVPKPRTLELGGRAHAWGRTAQQYIIFYGCSPGRPCSESSRSLNSSFPDGTLRAGPRLVSVPPWVSTSLPQSHDLVLFEKDHVMGFSPEEYKNKKLIKSPVH